VPPVVLLRNLAADFAALVRFRVHVDVPFASQQLSGLSIGEGGRTLERAGRRGDRNGNTAILSRLTGVEMRGGSRPRQV
jgi:hypothetical protein